MGHDSTATDYDDIPVSHMMMGSLFDYHNGNVVAYVHAHKNMYRVERLDDRTWEVRHFPPGNRSSVVISGPLADKLVAFVLLSKKYGDTEKVLI